MDWDEDVELLERWRRDDMGAGEQLFDRHGDAVVRFFHNKVGVDAQDLIQETFLRLVSARERIGEGKSFRAFVLGIARRVLYEHLRKLQRARAVDPESHSIAALQPGPSTLAVARAEQRLLLDGLRRLALNDQIVLELHYWEGLKANEIAEVMGVTHSAMRTRIQRARDRLRVVLAELEASPDLLSSTVARLDEWAVQIRDAFAKG